MTHRIDGIYTSQCSLRLNKYIYGIHTRIALVERIWIKRQLTTDKLELIEGA